MKIIYTAAAVYLLTVLPAFAQDTSINLGEVMDPWMQLLLSFAALVIPALAAWAAAELRRRTGIAIGQAHMITLQQALTNGAGLILNTTRNAAGNVNIDVRNQTVRDVIRYVNASAPDAIAYFGLTPDSLAEKLVAKVGLVQATSGPVTNVVNQTPPTGSPPA